MPVEREIINVYDHYDVFEPVGLLITYFLRGAPPRTPLGRLQSPSDCPTFKMSLISDHSLAALPFRHLAINLSGGGIYAKTAA